MTQDFKVGAILENSVRQFAKIIAVREGNIYGLSGWTTRESAEKATVAHKFVNSYGLEYAGARVVKGGTGASTKTFKSDTDDTGNDQPVAPKASTPPKSDAKKKVSGAAKDTARTTRRVTSKKSVKRA